MLGFFLGWIGAPGSGRALGLGQLKFTGQILPETRLVQYSIDIKRIINRRLVLGVADGQVRADGKLIYDCLLYTSDAADERSSVDLGGRRIIKKKNRANSV